MTSGAASFDASPATASPRARFAEFLLVGGATLFLVPFVWLLRAGLGLDRSALAVGFVTFYAAYVVNDPHFAVTYLLFYRDAKKRLLGRDASFGQRLRALVAGVLVPGVLAAWIAVAFVMRSAQAIGWMVQLMFLLVGWHYVKQGFGVLVVLWARRGRFLDARERTAVLAHCFSAWAFAWARRGVGAGEFEQDGVVYAAAARPTWIATLAAAPLALSTIALAALLVARWRRDRASAPLGPLAAFLLTVWSWTVFANADPLMQYLVPALHSVQYLYFVGLLKRNEARASEGPPSFGRPATVVLVRLALASIALAWLLFKGVPGFLDETLVARARLGGTVPEAMGATPFVAAFFAAVNIHHYFMDHVLWRRENPETRFLRQDAR